MHRPPALRFAVLLVAAPMLCSAAPAADDSGLAARIAAVEADLQPPVAISGAAPVRRRLADEMARLGVPG
ncbi:MAG TPA: hypothetical protein VF774_24630, partial [Pseudoduganella sp.]